MQTVMAEHCTDTSERVTCPAMKHQIGWHFGHVQRQSGHVYLQNRGLWECAFCTPLYIFSVLTYALIGKKKQMTRLNSLHPYLGACKTQKNKNKKTTENQKKTRKPRRPTGPECLWHRVGFFWFLIFVYFFLFFCCFWFSCFFCFLLVLVTFDLLEVLLALSQIFPIIWRS